MLLVWVAMSLSQEGREGAVLPKSLLKAAESFVAGLSADERKQAVYSFDDEERFNWHFVPKMRNGLHWKDMGPATQALGTDLLRASLSKSGWKKVETIRSLENVLREMENGNAIRDPGLYTFTIFGSPSAKGTWGWRFEGHHLSLNWTMANGRVLATSPQFLGTNPAEVRSGPLKGTRALAIEEDLARELVTSLTAEQRKRAVVSDVAPSDIITGAARRAQIEGRKGIAFGAMSKRQQGLLLALIQEHASVQRPSVSKARMDRVRKERLDEVVFAWMGGLERGQGHYYRIQGDAFLIEYDNTQNSANHIHAVWRDFDGDFGVDLLKAHYSAHASGRHGHPHRH